MIIFYKLNNGICLLAYECQVDEITEDPQSHKYYHGDYLLINNSQHVGYEDCPNQAIRDSGGNLLNFYTDIERYDNQGKWNVLESEIMVLLKDSLWMVVPDSPLSGQDKTTALNYRAALMGLRSYPDPDTARVNIPENPFPHIWSQS